MQSSGAGDGPAEVQMYREFLEDVRARKPSPLNPDAALAPSLLAYGAATRQVSVVDARK